MMQEFFAENGHRVTTVHNGRDGLAALWRANTIS